MSTLWAINEQIENLTEHLIDDETGEINEEVMAQLEQLDIDRHEKLEHCGIKMKSLDGEIEALSAEIKALTQRRSAKANRLASLGEYVKNNLKGEKFETSKVAFSFRPSQRAEVVNEEIIPDEWWDIKTVRKPMLGEIKKALKDGAEVPGCVLVDRTNLQIK